MLFGLRRPGGYAVNSITWFVDLLPVSTNHPAPSLPINQLSIKKSGGKREAFVGCGSREGRSRVRSYGISRWIDRRAPKANTLPEASWYRRVASRCFRCYFTGLTSTDRWQDFSMKNSEPCCCRDAADRSIARGTDWFPRSARITRLLSACARYILLSIMLEWMARSALSAAIPRFFRRRKFSWKREPELN